MDIRLIDIETAVPENKVTQSVLREQIAQQLKPSGQALMLYERILSDDSIESRHFGCDHLQTLLTETEDEKSGRFQSVAVSLASQALEKLLKRADVDPGGLDALFIATCTGYLCPGLTSYVAQAMDLPETVFCLDIVGAGCAGGLVAMRSAEQYLQSHPHSRVAVIAVEVCSAAIHWAPKPELILSNCIFSDGACACLLSNKDPRPGLLIKEIVSSLLPQYRDELRFKYADGRLCNVLSPRVPALAAGMVLALHNRLTQGKPADFYALHSGGRKVLDAIQEKIKLSSEQVFFSREILKNYGNISSPSVLFVLKEIFQRGSITEGQSLLAFSFGAGFCGLGLLGEWRDS
jgi:predicted naringenin-chalcone synthase